MFCTDILVLDSGVSIKHPALACGNIHFLFGEQSDKDQNGHGTAVTAILYKHVSSAKITVGKILDVDGECAKEVLISVLEYIYQNVNCKVLHMSLGVREDCQELNNICKKIHQKGTVLVAAFDNAGGVSYPAAYPFVIGVDASVKCKKDEDFVFVENSIVNIKAKGGVQRLAWLDNTYIIAQGASFAAAYVSAYIMKSWEHTNGDHDKILYKFKSIARYIYDFKASAVRVKPDLSFIKKAGVFPYNKEIHGLIHFQDMLHFAITDIYDIKYLGNVGKKIKIFKDKRETYIKNIDELNDKRIDTLIIGHITEIESALNQTVKKDILQRCLDKKINVFMFDNREYDLFKTAYTKAGLKLEYATSTLEKITQNNFGKLFSPNAPVLGVFGTTSKQGKFTLQMELRRRFLRDNYKVAQIGSEPSAQLFGIEAYPFGYDANTHIDFCGNENIIKLNSLIHNMDLENPDIIIGGSQSGTVPLLYNNIGQFTLPQLTFLLGILPDIVVLCVNYDDSISYVERTINAITGMADSVVLALAVYPKYYKNGWKFANMHQEFGTNEQLRRYATELTDRFSIPAFVMNSINSYESIYQYCIRFLAGE